MRKLIEDNEVRSMAVSLFTFRAYRSWMPDRPQGYVLPGKGILPQNHDLARVYNDRAKHQPVRFDDDMGWTIIDAIEQIVAHNEWILYEAVVVPSHVHALSGWRNYQAWKEVSNRLKRGIGLELSRYLNRPGPWFSRGSSRKRVEDRKHFDHLLDAYLPSHGDIRWTLRHTRTAADLHPQLLEPQEDCETVDGSEQQE